MKGIRVMTDKDGGGGTKQDRNDNRDIVPNMSKFMRISQ